MESGWNITHDRTRCKCNTSWTKHRYGNTSNVAHQYVKTMITWVKWNKVVNNMNFSVTVDSLAKQLREKKFNILDLDVVEKSKGLNQMTVFNFQVRYRNAWRFQGNVVFSFARTNVLLIPWCKISNMCFLWQTLGVLFFCCFKCIHYCHISQAHYFKEGSCRVREIHHLFATPFLLRVSLCQETLQRMLAQDETKRKEALMENIFAKCWWGVSRISETINWDEPLWHF